MLAFATLLMMPDVIVIPSGGTVPATDEPRFQPNAYRSTSYEEGDASGLLGGIARVQAAALLARTYPEAALLASGARGAGEPSHAAIIASELEALGVRSDRIFLEETSKNTFMQLQETLAIALARGWKNVTYVTNEYQCERVEAFLAHMTDYPEYMKVTCQPAEPLLIDTVPGFREQYEEIKTRSSYQERVAAEERGVRAIENGTYHPASTEDKQERAI